MSFVLSDVMDGLALRVEGLAPQVYAWPAESVTVPCIVIGFPTTIDYDTAFYGGGDRLVFPLWYVVGKSGTKSARDALSEVMSGAQSIKQALDGSTAFGDLRATDASIEEISIAAVTYLAAMFTVEAYV